MVWEVRAWEAKKFSGLDFKWPDADGFVVDSAGKPITKPANLKAGQIIDRYGEPYGRFTIPVENGQKLSYDTRGLPYPEEYQVYHQYEVMKDISRENIIKAYSEAPQNFKNLLNERLSKYGNPVDVLSNVKKGQVANIFGQGGGIQIQMGSNLEYYEILGFLKEVK